MNTKKTAFIIAGFISTIAMSSAHFASASYAWTPLVKIPGLPATGTVTLSTYMIGIYDFLLSIVGIVAVIMLIIGGMRYITAVGNSAAIGDAKDIITNAIVGLLLALLSWVFIATINPDALYIRQPGSSFTKTASQSVCYTSFDAVSNKCTCKDGKVFTDTAITGVSDCENKCVDNCSLIKYNVNCVATGGTTTGEQKPKPEKGYIDCKCLDGATVSKILTTTTLTSPASGSTFTTGDNVTISGTVTATVNGANLSSLPVEIYSIYNDKMHWLGNPPIQGDGTYSIDNATPPIQGGGCAGTFQLVAYFKGGGDNPPYNYTPSLSNPVTITTTGGTDCTDADFKQDTSFTKLQSIKDCNAVCSTFDDPTDFHCLVPKLGVGTELEASLGIQTIALIPIGGPVFFNGAYGSTDGVPRTLNGFNIGEIDVDYESSFWDWTGNSYEYKCALNGGCAGSDATVAGCHEPIGDDRPWKNYQTPGTEEGKFVHAFTSAGTKPMNLKIGLKMPDGTCVFKIENNVNITVQ